MLELLSQGDSLSECLVVIRLLDGWDVFLGLDFELLFGVGGSISIDVELDGFGGGFEVVQ